MADDQTSLLDSAVLGRLAALPLFARQAMLGNVSGKHRSPVKGSSLEFSQYRKYVPGDDTRYLDWRTWGRTDRFYIKEFEADTNLRICLLIDVSGSMAFASKFGPRLHYATKLAGTLGYLAANQGDAVGLHSLAETSLLIPAKRGAVHFKTVLDNLAKLKAGGKTTLLEALHHAAESVRQRALICIFSDFFVQPSELKGAVRHLRFRKHDVVAFHLLDPQELAFDFDQPTHFVDIEGGDAIFADPSLIADNYRTAIRKYMAEMDEIMSASGVDYHRINVNQPYEDVLARFLIGRTPKRAAK
jgi:uncharacterized protein (DUF58 family)